MDVTRFRDKHKGKPMLLVGNGENLTKTPPEDFDHPSIGMNTIHLYEGDWRPDYYVAVDRRVMNEFGDAIYAKFKDIPKFTPKPKLLRWRGSHFYRFAGRPGPLWPRGDERLWQGDFEKNPVTWGLVMHVVIKLAYFMGANPILITGMQHKANNSNAHFWGVDEGMTGDAVDLKTAFKGYQQLVEGLHHHEVEIFNISEDTYVPKSIIPRDKAKNWQ